MLLRKALNKLLDDDKVQYEEHVVQSKGLEPLMVNIIFYEEWYATYRRGRTRGNIHPITIEITKIPYNPCV